MSLAYAFGLFFEFVLVALYINAFTKQPTRPEARVGLGVNVLYLAFEVFAFAYARNDAQAGILFLPLAVAGPPLLSISAYRLYRHWDRKYWDPASPDFLGYSQTATRKQS